VLVSPILTHDCVLNRSNEILTEEGKSDVNLAGALMPAGEFLLCAGRICVLPELVKLARNHRTQIRVPPERITRVEEHFRVLVQAASQGIEVYGLTVGVGKNKDVPIFEKKLATSTSGLSD